MDRSTRSINLSDPSYIHAIIFLSQHPYQVCLLLVYLNKDIHRYLHTFIQTLGMIDHHLLPLSPPTHTHTYLSLYIHTYIHTYIPSSRCLVWLMTSELLLLCVLFNDETPSLLSAIPNISGLRLGLLEESSLMLKLLEEEEESARGDPFLFMMITGSGAKQQLREKRCL